MFIAQSCSPKINRPRVIAKAQEMVEMMRGCQCSLDPEDHVGILKLARALRTVLTKGEISLKEIGYTAAEINALIVDVPNRSDSVSSYGFLEEQMQDEVEALEEVDAELVEEEETELGEVSKIRLKPVVHASWICGNSREPHIKEDLASLFGDLGDEQLTEMVDNLLPTG